MQLHCMRLEKFKLQCSIPDREICTCLRGRHRGRGRSSGAGCLLLGSGLLLHVVQQLLYQLLVPAQDVVHLRMRGTLSKPPKICPWCQAPFTLLA